MAFVQDLKHYINTAPLTEKSMTGLIIGTFALGIGLSAHSMLSDEMQKRSEHALSQTQHNLVFTTQSALEQQLSKAAELQIQPDGFAESINLASTPYWIDARSPVTTQTQDGTIILSLQDARRAAYRSKPNLHSNSQ